SSDVCSSDLHGQYALDARGLASGVYAGRYLAPLRRRPRDLDGIHRQRLAALRRIRSGEDPVRRAPLHRHAAVFLRGCFPDTDATALVLVGPFYWRIMTSMSASRRVTSTPTLSG